MTGTRAYAVRDDLKTYNRRLLEYVNGGGNLIVLYNTQEFVPNLYAPYPATLSGRRGRGVGGGLADRDPRARRSGPQHAEPDHRGSDFDNWVEQRGSKFWDDVGCAGTRR